MLPENLRLAAIQRREELDRLLAAAGNPSPDNLYTGPVTIRCEIDHDPFDEGRTRPPDGNDLFDAGDTSPWKGQLTRLKTWATQTAELLRRYDSAVAHQFERVAEEMPLGYNAKAQFAKLACEYYGPTLDSVIGDPLSASKLLVAASEPPGGSTRILPVHQTFNGPIASLQMGAHSAASVTQNIGEPTAPHDLELRKDAIRKWQRLSIEEARKCQGESGKVSPKVGVVVVKDDQAIAVAHRGELKEGEHGEYTALERKLAKATLSGCTVFTSLEPCTTRNHPKLPCANWLIERRVAKVFIGMLDPNPDIFGKGLQRLRDAGVAVELYDSNLQDEIEELNREFIRVQRRRATERAGALAPGPVSAGFWAKPDDVARLELRAPTLYLGNAYCSVGLWLWTVQRLPPGIRILESTLRVLLDGVPLNNADVQRDPLPLEQVGRTDLRTRQVRLDTDKKYSKSRGVSIAAELDLAMEVPGGPGKLAIRVCTEEQMCKVVK